MVKREELAAQLRNYGLTQYEANVYLALVRDGILSAPAAAKSSGVPKSQVYNTLNSLISKGLVEEFPGQPRKFKASPPDYALNSIIESKKKELEKLKRGAESIRKSIEGRISQSREDTGFTPQIWMARGRRRFRDKYIEMFNRSQREFKAITSTFSIYPGAAEVLRDVRQRGVKLKAISNLDENTRLNLKFYANYFDEIRVIDEKIPITIVIIDSSECMYRIKYKSGREIQYIAVDSTDEGLVKTFEKYWDALWKEAKKLTPEMLA